MSDNGDTSPSGDTEEFEYVINIDELTPLNISSLQSQTEEPINIIECKEDINNTELEDLDEELKWLITITQPPTPPQTPVISEEKYDKIEREDYIFFKKMCAVGIGYMGILFVALYALN